MATENLVTGKYYRILKDKANDIWDRISFWTHADDVQVSSGVTLTSDLDTKNTKITATQTDFATIESSSVAAHAYIKGNLLVYNNQLYRAMTAIAVGNTLTVGTNIEAVNVGTLSNMLTASNGNGFYFDVKNGTYGFYPTASKASSEFVPFGGTLPTKLLCKAWASAPSFTAEDGIYIADTCDIRDSSWTVGTEYSGYILSSSGPQYFTTSMCVFSVSGSTVNVIIGMKNPADIRVTYNSGNIQLVQSSLSTTYFHIVCLKLK